MPGRLTMDALEALVASDKVDTVLTVVPDGFGRLVGKRLVARFFLGHDILLSPTMCQPPHPLGVLDMNSTNDKAYLDAFYASIGFTSLFNASGNPAMSVPLVWSRAGLPLGVQFVAPFGAEGLLFRLASQLESAAPWVDRRPPLPA